MALPPNRNSPLKGYLRKELPQTPKKGKAETTPTLYLEKCTVQMRREVDELRKKKGGRPIKGGLNTRGLVLRKNQTWRRQMKKREGTIAKRGGADGRRPLPSQNGAVPCSARGERVRPGVGKTGITARPKRERKEGGLEGKARACSGGVERSGEKRGGLRG